MRKIILVILLILIGFLLIINADVKSEKSEKVENWKLEKTIGFGEVNAIAYSPDGNKIAVGCSLIQILNSSTFQVENSLVSHTNSVKSLSFSPNGTYLASGSYDDTIKIWDTKQWNVIKTIEAHTDNVLSLAFSPNGSYLASSSRDHTIKIWNTKNWNEIKTFTEHTDKVLSVTFSPNGTYLISGSFDYTIKIWNMKNLSIVKSINKHESAVLCVKFSNNGSYLASASSISKIIIWNISTWNEIRTLDTHTESVYSVEFSPNDEFLVSGSGDRTIKIWNTTNWTEIKTLNNHSNEVFCVIFSPKGSYFLSGSEDHTIIIWNTTSGQEIKTIGVRDSSFHSLTFDPTGNYLASASSNNTVKIWSVNNFEVVQTLAGHTNDIFTVEYNPNGSYLASGSIDKTVKIWDTKTWSEIITLEGHTDWVWDVSFSPNGSYLASCSNDNTIYIRNTKNWEIVKILTEHTRDVYKVGFSPNGTYLISCGYFGEIRIWNTTTWEEIKDLKVNSYHVKSLGISPNGNYFATGHAFGKIRIWDMNKLIEIKSFQGHTDIIYSLVFSPNGKLLFSCSDDNFIRIWNTTTWKEIKNLTGHLLSIISLALPFDGSYLISGSPDGTMRVWGEPKKKDWIVTGLEIRTNEIIFLDGNLTIENTGKLTFNNVTLIMNCSYPGEFYIKVKNGGEFYIYDNDENNQTTYDASNITAMNPDYNFNFSVEKGAKLIMKNSELHESGGKNSGLEIESDDVLIVNNLISNNNIGIFCNFSNPMISNNTIINNNGTGIFCNNSIPLIIDNLIKNNEKIGIYCQNSDAKIINNKISNHTHGIYCLLSNPTIINCTINNSTYNDNDIHLFEDSHVILINTTFDEVNFNHESKPPSLKNQHFIHFEVINQFETPLVGANIRIQDNENGTLDEEYKTDSNGAKKWILLTEYNETEDGKIYFTPYTINASINDDYTQKKVTFNESTTLKIIIEEKVLEVMITNPENGDTVKDIITITADIKNAKNLEYIAFYIDPNLLEIIGWEVQNSTKTTFEWNTSEYENSEYTIIVSVEDERYFVWDSIILTIFNKIEKPENHAPVIITSDILKANISELYSVQYEVNDEDIWDVHTWNLETNASWLNLDINGILFGTPNEKNIGSYWVNITVIDNGTPQLFDYSNFTLTVVDNETTQDVEPKIEINKIWFQKQALEGKEITINATIKNIGTIPILNFTVIFYYGDKQIGSKVIENTLDVGGEITINLKWKAILGNYTIKVEVKTIEGKLLASKESSEKLEVRKAVNEEDKDKGNEDEKDDDNKFPIFIFLVPIIIILILIAVFVLIKKGKSK